MQSNHDPARLKNPNHYASTKEGLHSCRPLLHGGGGGSKHGGGGGFPKLAVLRYTVVLNIGRSHMSGLNVRALWLQGGNDAEPVCDIKVLHDVIYVTWLWSQSYDVSCSSCHHARGTADKLPIVYLRHLQNLQNPMV